MHWACQYKICDQLYSRIMPVKFQHLLFPHLCQHIPSYEGADGGKRHALSNTRRLYGNMAAHTIYSHSWQGWQMAVTMAWLFSGPNRNITYPSFRSKVI